MERTDEEKMEIGKFIVKLLKLKTHYAYAKDEENIRVNTTWGTKTYLGVYNTLDRIINEESVERLKNL